MSFCILKGHFRDKCVISTPNGYRYKCPLNRFAGQRMDGYEYLYQGFVKGEVFCFKYLDSYFLHGESTSTTSQKSQELKKVPLL